MILLGNLTIEQMEARTGVTFSEELKNFLKETYQANATNIAPNKWHCFDIPFTLVCGDMQIAQKIYNYLKLEAKNFKEPLQISINS